VPIVQLSLSCQLSDGVGRGEPLGVGLGERLGVGRGEEEGDGDGEDPAGAGAGAWYAGGSYTFTVLWIGAAGGKSVFAASCGTGALVFASAYRVGTQMMMKASTPATPPPPRLRMNSSPRRCRRGCSRPESGWAAAPNVIRRTLI
jgi:hypothetical protein